MPDPAQLRDSTQVVVPREDLADIRDDLEEFTVTVLERDDHVRIIGSPVEIQRLTDHLSRRGLRLP